MDAVVNSVKLGNSALNHIVNTGFIDDIGSDSNGAKARVRGEFLTLLQNGLVREVQIGEHN